MATYDVMVEMPCRHGETFTAHGLDTPVELTVGGAEDRR
jgi:hypothetical protein